jgi:hypothetical protein
VPRAAWTWLDRLAVAAGAVLVGAAAAWL